MKPLDLEKIQADLKAFDLTTRYGPCVGISRLDRWNRAERLGKAPPAHIKELLEDPNLQAHLDDSLTQALWHGVI